MPTTIRGQLTKNEIEFVELWEREVVPNKYRVQSDSINRAAALLNHHRTGNCQTCLRNDAINLNNFYRRLKPKYDEEMKRKDEKKEAKKRLTSKKKNREAAKNYLKNKETYTQKVYKERNEKVKETLSKKNNKD